MTRHVQQPAERTDRAATLALTAALARWQMVPAAAPAGSGATAWVVCHCSQLALEADLGDGFAEHLTIRP